MDDAAPADHRADDDDSSATALLRQYLAARDVPCPQCDYNLRALLSPVCPECGERLALGVHALEPRQAAPIAGLIGLSAGAGWNGMLLVYMVLMTMIHGRGGWTRVACMSIGGLLILGPLLATWLRNWRRLRRLSSRTRWWLVAGCWALTLADIIVFTLYIR